MQPFPSDGSFHIRVKTSLTIRCRATLSRCCRRIIVSKRHLRMHSRSIMKNTRTKHDVFSVPQKVKVLKPTEILNLQRSCLKVCWSMQITLEILFSANNGCLQHSWAYFRYDFKNVQTFWCMFAWLNSSYMFHSFFIHDADFCRLLIVMRIVRMIRTTPTQLLISMTHCKMICANYGICPWMQYVN